MEREAKKERKLNQNLPAFIYFDNCHRPLPLFLPWKKSME